MVSLAVTVAPLSHAGNGLSSVPQEEAPTIEQMLRTYELPELADKFSLFEGFAREALGNVYNQVRNLFEKTDILLIFAGLKYELDKGNSSRATVTVRTESPFKVLHILYTQSKWALELYNTKNKPIEYDEERNTFFSTLEYKRTKYKVSVTEEEVDLFKC
jgi:hypothetical protein